MMDHVSWPENAGPENDGQILLQNTAPENDGPRKSEGLKMQDQNKAEHIAWLENARPENAELENAAVLRKRIEWPRKRISKYYKNTRKHRQTEMATIIAWHFLIDALRFRNTAENAGPENDGPAGQVSFRSLESSMYKRRRLALPALPSCPEDGAPFYLGLSDPKDSGSARYSPAGNSCSCLKMPSTYTSTPPSK